MVYSVYIYRSQIKTKNKSYLIDLTYDKTYKDYVADVVKLYGCMSQGKTKKDAVINAKKAIRVYMEALEKSEDKASTFHEIVNIPTFVVSA